MSGQACKSLLKTCVYRDCRLQAGSAWNTTGLSCAFSVCFPVSVLKTTARTEARFEYVESEDLKSRLMQDNVQALSALGFRGCRETFQKFGLDLLANWAHSGMFVSGFFLPGIFGVLKYPRLELGVLIEEVAV